MRRFIPACLLAVLLTGIVMPDAPVPKRHARSPLTSAREKLEAGAAEAEKEAAIRQPTSEKKYLRPPDRSARRQAAPAKRIR